jgi:hypothetical protein
MTGIQSSNVLLGNPGAAALIDALAAIIRKDAGSDQRLGDGISAETSGYFSQTRPIFKLT